MNPNPILTEFYYKWIAIVCTGFAGGFTLYAYLEKNMFYVGLSFLFIILSQLALYQSSKYTGER